jgi:hypothetical protein
MPLSYLDLDARTREFMIEEIEFDVHNNTLYKSPRLTSNGERDWPDMLRDAAANGSDASLAEQIRRNGRLKDSEERAKPKGGYTIAKVPVTAPETLAEGEFNRFYIRALCRRAISEGIGQVTVYRAKEVERPRVDSAQKIGTIVDPNRLLQDLRAHTGVDTALGLPQGPNSGLSVRLSH